MSSPPQPRSRIAVLAALAGNLAIAVSKFVAFLVGGSTAMLTEAVHSTVDTANQLLLLHGMRRAARKPDEGHPFGHGMEIYFWSFVVALLMFAAGGAASIWQGASKLLAPHPIEKAWLSLLVLALAAVFEASSFLVALRQQKSRWPSVRLLPFLKRSKDPGLFAVLLEDGAALIGIAVAAAGVVASAYLGFVRADGIASIAIGLLLVAVAVFMANETRSLLTGEAAAPAVVEKVRLALEEDRDVERVLEVLSLHLGPEEILLGITIRFRDGATGRDIRTAARRLTHKLEEVDGRITRVFLRPERDTRPPRKRSVKPGPHHASGNGPRARNPVKSRPVRPPEPPRGEAP